MQFGVNKHIVIIQRKPKFVVFETFKSAYSHQIAREIMLFLDNNVQEKTSQKVKTDEILKACACYLCFALV